MRRSTLLRAVSLGLTILALACGSRPGGPLATSATESVRTSPSTFRAAALPPMINPVERLAGTVRSVDGDTVTLEDGSRFRLTAGTALTRSRPGQLADLAPDRSVGLAAEMQPDSSLRATSVSVYTSTAGAAAIHEHPLDHRHIRINATINSVSGVGFTITFSGGTANVFLAPDATLTAVSDAVPADLDAGDSITALVLEGVAQVISIL